MLQNALFEASDFQFSRGSMPPEPSRAYIYKAGCVV